MGSPDTGVVLSARLTRAQLEDLLDQHDTFTLIDQTIRRALRDAHERGYDEEHVKAVLMVGGSSQIPSVQKMVRRIFGKDRVMLHHPLDAVARGAAAFVAGVDFYDHIQHDYAIRHVNREKGGYNYRRIIERGTPYPSKQPVDSFTVKAAYDGQTQLGIAIYEMGERYRTQRGPAMELVFDPTGAARLSSLTPEEEEQRTYFWMNEQNPTFLTANPPATQGEARFMVEFTIDMNKRLLITAWDLHSDQIMLQECPVVKLT
jgi:molecular chaperone DnaK (HSP70)